MDRPVLRCVTDSQHGSASINDAATSDIGAASDLRVLVIGDTFNQLNYAKQTVGRPYN